MKKNSPSNHAFHQDSFSKFLTSKLVIAAIITRLLVFLFVDMENLTKWWPLLKTKFHDFERIEEAIFF